MEITNLSNDKNNFLEKIFKLSENNTNVKFEHVTQRDADRAKAILNNYKNRRQAQM